MPQLESQITVENDEVFHFFYHRTCALIPFLFTFITHTSQVRTELVRLLSRMFGHKDSTLHTTYRKLFEAFLKRFTDKSETIREIMLDFLSHYLLCHDDYAPEFSSTLIPSFLLLAFSTFHSFCN
jgi:hypothetical protein